MMWRVYLLGGFYSDQIAFIENGSCIKDVFSAYVIPINLELAAIHQCNKEISLVDHLKIDPNPEVGFRVGGEQLPQGCSFKGVPKHAIQEITGLHYQGLIVGLLVL